MIPRNNFRYVLEHDSESSEDEESTPDPAILSDDSNSSVDSTSTSNSISVDNSVSADDSAAPVPSTSTTRMVDLTSPMPGTSSYLTIIPGPSTSSGSQMFSAQITPVPPTMRGSQENSDDFRFEGARRSSFRDWSGSFTDTASLAAAGLYYTGVKDIVQCFECLLMVGQWSEGHTPLRIHESCSPECRFVRNEYCGNVPIGADPDKVLRTKRRNRNISCPYGLIYQDSFDFNDHRFLRNSRNPSAYELSRLGLKRVKKPENMEYASYESRLNSFATWPTYMSQKNEKLAEAGFYYTGINDITICYHCGIGIGNWRAEEDPWEQHALSSPGCCYLLTVLGCEYVNNITGQELYETSAEAPIQITDSNDATSDSESESDDMTLVQKVATLEEENRALKNARSCKVCTEREATITFLPCGHLATCHYCSPAFAQCIICRQEIKAVTRTFFA